MIDDVQNVQFSYLAFPFLLQSSVEKCAFACQRDPSGPCEAFTIADVDGVEDVCQFGKVDMVDATGCQITVREEVGNAIYVMLDTTVYGRKTGRGSFTPSDKIPTQLPLCNSSPEFVLSGPNPLLKVIKLSCIRYHMVESRSLNGP